MMPVCSENKIFIFQLITTLKHQKMANFSCFLDVERHISKMGGRNLMKFSHFVQYATRMMSIFSEGKNINVTMLRLKTLKND